ncbi:MAG: hypothetical protein KDB53_01415, partial [Planctomycetes bacterium]|nr:hypothetical protein [Planctomycetota bacterium]
MSTISFVKDPTRALAAADLLVFVAPKSFFGKKWLEKTAGGLDLGALGKAAAASEPGSLGTTVQTLLSGKKSQR